MGIGWTRQSTGDTRQVKGEYAFVFSVFKTVGPQARMPRILLNQFDLIILASGQLEITDGLFVYIEHRGSSAILGRHIRDSRAVADSQSAGTLTIKFQVSTDHALLA